MYKTRPQLAAEILQKLKGKKFDFDLVLADTLYRASDTLITVINEFNLDYVLAIISNHLVLLPSAQKVTHSDWQRLYRIFTEGTIEYRYLM